MRQVPTHVLVLRLSIAGDLHKLEWTSSFISLGTTWIRARGINHRDLEHHWPT